MDWRRVGHSGCGSIVGVELKAGCRAAVFFCLQIYRFVVNRARTRRIFNNLLLGAGGGGALGEQASSLLFSSKQAGSLLSQALAPHGVMKWCGKSGFRIFWSRLRRTEAWTCSLARKDENGSCVELVFSLFARVGPLFFLKEKIFSCYIVFFIYIASCHLSCGFRPFCANFLRVYKGF